MRSSASDQIEGPAKGRAPRILNTALGLLVALFLAVKLLPASVVFGAIDLTGLLVVFFLKPFGVPAVYENTFITVSGFEMYLDMECSALYFLSIFFAAVVASPSHDARHKIKGFLAGSVIIVFINVLRIAILGLTGAYFPAIFDFVHIYLWQGLFAIAVFVIWLSWFKGPSTDRTLLTFCSVAIVASSLAILGLWLVMESYLIVLAGISEGILGTFLSDTRFSVIATEEKIVFDHAGNFVAFPISVDVYDSSIFFALMIASAKANDLARLAKQLVCGLGALSLVHLVFAIAVGYLVVQNITIGSELSNITLMMMRFLSILVPVVLWALMSPTRWAWSGEKK